MSTYQDRSARQRFHLLMVDHDEAQVAESAHLLVVMDNIAQTIEAAAEAELLFGGSDSFHHAEAEAGIFIDYDRHWFSWFAASITCSYS